jgi:hypothetical protein
VFYWVFLFCLSSSMMDYYKPNIPETEAVVGKDSDYCTIFFLVTTRTLSLSRLHAWWLTLAFMPVYHVSLTSGYCTILSLSLSPSPSPYFCAFFPLRDHDLRTRSWRMGGKADKLLVCSGLRCCSFLLLFLVLARAWCG